MAIPAPIGARRREDVKRALLRAPRTREQLGVRDAADVGEVAEAGDRVLGLDEASDDLDRVAVAAHRADLPGLGGGARRPGRGRSGGEHPAPTTSVRRVTSSAML